jgi:hypothetical protein
MWSYSSIAWLPLTAGLTFLGLVLSYLAYQRGGWRAGLRYASLSLLPIAAYMTGAIEMLWKVGVAIGEFGTGFVFSPERWIGVGVTGLAFALFLAAGGRVRRHATREAHKAARGEQQKNAATAGQTQQIATRTGTQSAIGELGAGRTPEPAPRKGAAAPAKGSRKSAAPDDDDMKDIEAILRNRGI